MTDETIRSGSSTVRSNGSSKYRRISSTSSVDESLFGSSKGSPKLAATKDRKGKALPSKPENVCISLNELQQIKDSALTKIEPLTSHDVTVPNIKKRTETEAAKARKEHMKQLEMKSIEDQKKFGIQKDSAKLERIRKQAREMIEESEDIVKVLKTCSERAATFAIRDQQLKDKAEREKKEQDYEQRTILAMEIDRLKEIESRELEEARKLENMVEGRKIIENQMAERHQARILLEEAREQENRAMLERIKLYQLEDEEKAKVKKDKATKARVEIMRANDEHIALKRERQLLEKREEEMMVAYQMEQDAKLRQREAEEEEAERKKREIQKKLLDDQKRLMDRQSEMDEIRARRAAEDAERKYRKKQLIEAQKKKRDMEALNMARKQQQREKLEKKQIEMLEKKEDYENAIRNFQSMAERERAEQERMKIKNAELIQNLQEQIEENSVAKTEQERQKYREGALIQEKLAEERAKLEAVREKMVYDMREKGIDERYFGEMTSLDIGKYLMK